MLSHIGEAELRITFWPVSTDKKWELHIKGPETFENMIGDIIDTNIFLFQITTFVEEWFTPSKFGISIYIWSLAENK